MFGYVRPYKPNLRIRDFTHYRAIYCGLCKTIKRNYGELPRLATNYDLTFMALLLLSFREQEIDLVMERCVANPVKAHGIAASNDVLDYTAAVTILLAAAKIRDNIDDGDHMFLSRVAALAFKRATSQASAAYPELAVVIQDGMKRVADYERRDARAGFSPPLAFGSMLADIFMLGLRASDLDDLSRSALRLSAEDLGQWVYYMDALEDYDDDWKKQEYNALSELEDIEISDEEVLAYLDAKNRPKGDLVALSEGEWAEMRACRVLQELELKIDQSLALLTYKHYGEMISNVICEGLFFTRMQLVGGEELKRI